MALSSQQQAELAGWLTLYTTGAAAADAQLVAAVQAAYASVDDFSDTAATLAAAALAASAVSASQDVQSGLMSQYVTGTIDAIANLTVTRRAPTVAYPRSTRPFDVYSRPIFKAREVLDRGGDGPTALLDAQQYAAVLAETDALLTRRDAAIALLDDIDEATGYRRVIRPELSETGICGLCIAAATRVYSRGDLMAIHTRCKCTVLPIINGEDPARDFNAEDLDALYAATPGTTRRDLAATRYRVRTDGEFGPLLVPGDRRGVPRGIPDDPFADGIAA